MRRFYDRASEKTHALRQALKNCRNCLRERDQQLDVANRVIEKLAGERATLQVCNIWYSTFKPSYGYNCHMASSYHMA